MIANVTRADTATDVSTGSNRRETDGSASACTSPRAAKTTITIGTKNHEYTRTMTLVHESPMNQWASTTAQTEDQTSSATVTADKPGLGPHALDPAR